MSRHRIHLQTIERHALIERQMHAPAKQRRARALQEGIE
jgi:hypothetical protein